MACAGRLEVLGMGARMKQVNIDIKDGIGNRMNVREEAERHFRSLVTSFCCYNLPPRLSCSCQKEE